MERAPALRRGLRSLAALSALGVLGAIAYSCAAERPAAPAAGRAQAPAKIVALRPPAAVVPVAPPQLSLEGFQPLLAQPGLAAVRTRLEAGQYGPAADTLAKMLAESPAPAGEAHRYRFLLGRLLERAGRAAEAREAFVSAAAAGSALSPYAELGAGRAELALGKPERALFHVGRSTETLPPGSGRRRLLADAALGAGAREIALREYRALLKEATSARERQGVGFVLLSALSAPVKAGPPARAELEEAIRLARSLSTLAEDEPRSKELALAEEQRLLLLLPASERAALSTPNAGERLERLRALVEARRFEAAQALAATFPALDRAASEPEACEIELLRGKSASGRKQSAQAEQLYAGVADSRCSDETRARALYAAGRAAQADDRYALSIKHFSELERRFSTQTLADDARLYSALASLEMGDEARFTEQLSAMPDDYPDGDMVAEGCFRLALRRMEKGDFASAERPLSRAVERLSGPEAGRSGEFAGRERFFLARVLVETGERERGLEGYEQLIAELPLGYYVRAAYSALSAADPARAERALAESVRVAEREPPSIAKPEQPSAPGFQRALELAAVGELEAVRAELTALAAGDAAAPELLFNAAVLYAKAGAVKLSSDAARLVLGKVPPRWPAGDWLQAWKLAYPRPYEQLVLEQARSNALSPSLVYAVMREESAFDPEAESPAAAYGLMQLILPTAKQMAKPLGLPHDRVSLKRPSVNISLGARVLSKYRDKFPQDPLLAIAAYNAGPGAALRWKSQRPGASFDLWVELIPYVETRRYIKRVLGSAAVYAIVYQESSSAQALALPSKLGG